MQNVIQLVLLKSDVIDDIFKPLSLSPFASILNLPKFVFTCLCEYYWTLKSTKIPSVSCIRALSDWRLSKNVDIYSRSISMTSFNEQEISMLRPYLNFASIKERFLEYFDFIRFLK